MNKPLQACLALMLAATTGCSSSTVTGSGDGGACAVVCGDSCCEAGMVCESNQCRPPAITGNNDCTNAYALAFASTGIASARGSTAESGGGQTGSCSGGKNSEVVFSFELTARSQVAITATSEYGSELHPAVYVRKDCATAASELGCGNSGLSSATATLTLPVVAPGTYFLFVDGSDDYIGSGSFTLKVAVTAPPQPAPDNDVCANAQTLTLDGTGKAGISAETTYATNDTQGACTAGAQMTGGDVVYAFTLAAPANVTVQVTSTGTGSNYRPAAYLRNGCAADAQEVGCGATANGKSVNISAPNLPAATYYVFVDGANGTAGAFSLVIATGTAPQNDTCAHPQPIMFDGSGKAEIFGDTTFARSDATNGGRTCSGDGGLDLVYSFVLDHAQHVKVTVKPTQGSAYSPVLYLRKQCDVQTSSVGCKASGNGQPVSVEVPSLGQGTYFIWVDGFSAGTSGAFDLTIETSEPQTAPNDTCASPEPIELNGVGQTVVSGSTADGVGDYQGTCGGTGADLVYTITLDQAASLTATAARDGTQNALSPVVYIRTDCTSAAAGDEIDCAAARTGGGSATATATYVPAGTYFVIVDGGQNAGAFTLTITVDAPVPNDTCAVPQDIPLDGTGTGHATGDTTDATNDTSGTCTNNAGTYGNDLVYSFTLAEEKTVGIRVTPSSNALKPAIYLRSSCADKPTEMACKAGTTASFVEINVPVLSRGTYYLWVDGNGTRTAASNGPFTISINTAAPPPPPANDDCAGAPTLNLTNTTDPDVKRATVNGDTGAARNSGEGVGFCAGANGGDVVYHFNLAQERMVVAKVTPSGTGYSPIVYLRRLCASAADSDMVACAAFDSINNQALATANALPAGDYFVWIDGRSVGAFSLEVTTSSPGSGPDNDNCSSPEALNLMGGTATVTGSTTGAENDTQSANGAGSGGPDVVYSFTTTQAQKITITATPTGTSQLRPVIIVRSGCATIANQVTSAIAARNAVPATATVANAAAGTYYVWIDSGGQVPATAGPFTLTVTLAAP